MNVAKVKLWEKTIGAVFVPEGQQTAHFEYDKAFQHSGIEIAPLTMPLANRVYTFPNLSYDTFHGLPGLLADSLPDRFGNALIDAWLATQGRTPGSFTPIERLCYTGTRGMGALEYAPVKGPHARKAKSISINHLVNLASEVLSNRSELDTRFGTDPEKVDALRDILRVGTSAGGARAKAVIAWNSQTNEVRSGQVETDPGFEHWLLKFDGVSGNKDKELEDPRGFGVIEYAYYLMAQKAGITMSKCRLLEENDRQHFMTRRFDRTDRGKKLHMHSLGAMCHFDFNIAGVNSYEQALQTIKRLELGPEAMEEQFRRMVFNIVARNQDDHVKNIAFLMDRNGHWSLAPAFDVTYSYQPDGVWTGAHQMSVNGKRDNFTRDDLRQCAATVSMKRGRADAILQEVTEAVSQWSEFAQQTGLSPGKKSKISKQHRLHIS